MSGSTLFAAEARQAVADLVAASTVLAHTLESAIDVFHAAEFDGHARALERIRELARLHHAQIDTIAARVTAGCEVTF